MHRVIWTFVAGIVFTGFAIAPTGVGITSYGIGIVVFAATVVLAYFQGRYAGEKEAKGELEDEREARKEQHA